MSQPNALCTGERQYFAWDEDSAGEGVVVCIGANYGQGDEKGQLRTKAKLTTWMSNYRRAAAHVSSIEPAWSLRGWLVGGALPPARPRYFVMSNLVPWITKTHWTCMSMLEVASLLPKEVDTDDNHLDDLANALPGAFAIGHGISNKILPHLPGVLRKWANWMLYANLSFPQTPSGWSDELDRFKFGGQARKITIGTMG